MFDPQDEIEIKKRLSEVQQEVKLTLFTQSLNCETCPEAETLVRDLAGLSTSLKLDVCNPHIDREKADQYGITRVPSLVIEGDRDYGIRYLGVPGGYEFAAILEDIIAISKRDSGLSQESREKIRLLDQPLDIKVFVTPT